MEKIELKTGDHIAVRLESLSMAGYTWNIQNSAGDIVSVEQVKHQAPSGNTLPAGRSVEQVYAVKALHAGEATVLFQQKRSWENAVLKEKAYLIKVR